MSPQERTVDLSAGTIHYLDSGTGEPLVFVHGILATHTLWTDVARRLEPEFRCIVPDWPLGSHREAMRPNAVLTPPALAELILEFCDALGIDDATFVGNDTGGALCQILAAEHPERVRHLVLTPSDAYDNFPPPKIFRLLKTAGRIPLGLWYTAQAMRFRWMHRLPFTFGHLAWKPIPRAIIDGWFEPLRRDRSVRRDLAKVLRSLSSTYTLQAAPRLRTLHAPALVVWAKDDPVFPFDHAQRLTADLGNAQLAIVDRSYAFVPLDQPAALADHVARFMRETTPIPGDR